MRGHETPCVLLAWRSRGDAAENGVFFLEIKNPQSLAVKGFNDGVPGRIRTCDAGIRRTALRGLGCRSNAPNSLAINAFEFSRVYLVAPKIPVPSLRGDAVVTDTRRETQGSPANPRPPPHGSPVPTPIFNGYVQNVVGFRRFLAPSFVLSTIGQGWNMRFVLTECYPAADWNLPTTSPTNHGHAQTLLRSPPNHHH